MWLGGFPDIASGNSLRLRLPNSPDCRDRPTAVCYTKWIEYFTDDEIMAEAKRRGFNRMSDFDLILRISEEIKADQNKPVLEQQINPLDEVAVALLYLEADNLVETYMQQYRAKYADQFERPERFDALVVECQKTMRRGVAKFIELTRVLISDSVLGMPCGGVRPN